MTLYTITVKDPDNNPIKYCFVQASAGTEKYCGHTDASGSVAFDLTTGKTYTIYIYKFGFEPISSSLVT